ncbi:MAG: PilZ domain-containing protein [Pseudomonadales bacterium]|nr:PilZ domain-containing protein [Pseudomonadales bacterium]
MAKRIPEKLSALHFNGRERRHSPRIRYDVNTVIEFAAGVIDVQLIDISKNGCSFRSEYWQPEVGQLFDLKLSLPECRVQLSVEVKICSRLGNKSGVEFVRMNADHSTLLQEVLKQNDESQSPPGFFSG